MSVSGTQPVPSNHHPADSLWKPWLLAFVVALVVYACTANRGVQWQDGGWQQYRIVSGQVDHPLGLALVHPVQHYLGRAAVAVLPIEPAFAVTLVSSLAGAVAIANLLLTILILTKRPMAAFVTAAAMMLSHTFWQHATHTESYTIVAALLTGEWLCLALYATSGKTRYIFILAFLNGLGVANHLLAALATPLDFVLVLILTFRKSISPKALLATIGLWLLGSMPYSILILAAMIRTQDIFGTIHSALFGEYANDVLNVHLNGKALLFSLGYIAYNFPGLTVPLALIGLGRRGNTPAIFTRTLVVLLLIYLVFAARYSIVDQYSFFFPVYALLALFAGLRLARLLERLDRRQARVLVVLAAITAIWTPGVYVITAHVLRTRSILANVVGNKPYRDGYRAFFVPWGVGASHAITLNQHALSLAGETGTILCVGPTIRYALEYEDALGRVSPNVEILQIDETAPPEEAAAVSRQLVEPFGANRPIVLIPMDRDAPKTCLSNAKWTRNGDLYLLKDLGPVDPPTPTTTATDDESP